MNILLMCLAILLPLIGMIGSILPVIPGMPLAWLGLLCFKFTPYCDLSWTIVWIGLAIVLILFLLDYILPIYTTKKSGGTKYGAWGATIGLVIGFFLPIPFGFLLGLAAGAFIGELIHDSNDFKKASKSSIGSFIGVLSGVFIKVLICCSFLGYILYDALI